jgi:hypothetical protein
MDLDQLFMTFFGTTDLSELEPAEVASGIERLRLEFGMEKDEGRRFALWCFMYMLGVAPDLDVAFKDEADREAARDFMDMADEEEDED